ncbi:hypothetical protein XENTR_v10014026 [Xenopus tropicalis]|nr:hypothetical protein XENTR_v10014026 [Xenopus tropicalis]
MILSELAFHIVKNTVVDLKWKNANQLRSTLVHSSSSFLPSNLAFVQNSFRICINFLHQYNQKHPFVSQKTGMRKQPKGHNKMQYC